MLRLRALSEGTQRTRRKAFTTEDTEVHREFHSEAL